MTTILEKAAAYIAEHGWVQGENFADEEEEDWVWERVQEFTPAACALGAIYAVSDTDPDEVGVTEEVRDARERLSGFINSAPVTRVGVFSKTAVDVIADWNDAPGRTAEDVILTLRRAAAADD